VAILRPARTILPEFLSFYLSLQDGGQEQIARAQYGQTKPGLNFEQIRAFRVPVPVLEIQRRFVELLQCVDAMTVRQNDRAARLESLFRSIQYHAFNGGLSSFAAVQHELEAAD
jgi:type I restriction enzyme S subunit